MYSKSQLSDLIHSISSAKVYDLEQVRYNGMPYFMSQTPGYHYFLHRRHGEKPTGQPGSHGHTHPGTPLSATSGQINSTDHVGTHIDALCHCAYEGMLYGGIKVSSEIQREDGYTVHGAELIPLITSRGILIDAPAIKGVDALPEGYEITKEDMQECLSSQGVEINKGDTVLARTGYDQFWMTDHRKYLRAAGVSKEVDLWLADKGVSVIGCDNTGWDHTYAAPPKRERTHFAHEYLLAQRGIYIIENMNLEPLSTAKCYEFLFVCLPLKFRGATASWVRPIALNI